MFLNNIQLINWRSYDEASFSFGPGVNAVVGENARGKTNILEAITVLATTKSFRVNKDRVLINKGADFAKIMAKYSRGEVDIDEEVRLILGSGDDFKKELRLDGVVVRALDVLGKLLVVIFSPDEIDSFFTQPALRRRWMDLVLSATDSDYAYCAAVYKKVVANRNKVLKRLAAKQTNQNELEFWDTKWASLASVIIGKRRKLIDFVATRVGDFYNGLFGGQGEVEVYYEQTCRSGDLEGELREILSSQRGRELRYGTTMAGPHREDLVVKMNGVVMADWGSRAQLRMTLLSLKLSEGEYVYEVTGIKPVLLLDDIFSELDHNNRGRVMDYVGGYQVILTTTSLEGIDKAGEYNVIEV
ncbi:MAG: DNA replication and repair protein RecF [Patescibacteria group bacterium]